MPASTPHTVSVPSGRTSVYGGMPPPSSLPSWLAGVADKNWVNVRAASGQGSQLRNVVGGSNGISVAGQFQSYPGDEHLIGAWNTAIHLPDHYAIVCAGGHRKTSDNGVHVFGPFNSETPTWTRVIDPEASQDMPATATPYTPSGRPASRHGYAHHCYIPDLGGGVGHQWFSMRCGAPWGSATGGHPKTDTFNFGANPASGGTFDAAGTNADFPGSLGAEPGACAYDSVNERVYATGGSGDSTSRRLFEFNPIARTWTAHGVAQDFNARAAIVDPVRRLFIVIDWNATPNGIGVWDLATANFADAVAVLPTGTAVATTSKPSLMYEPVSGDIFAYDGGPAIKRLVIPATYRNGGADTAQPITQTTGWAWEAVSGIGGAPPDSEISGTYGKCGYISSIHAFAVQSALNDDMWVFKLPAAGL